MHAITVPVPDDLRHRLDARIAGAADAWLRARTAKGVASPPDERAPADIIAEDPGLRA